MVGEPAIFGILTVSDRAHSGEYDDQGGPAILGFFDEAINSPWTHHYRVVPDELDAISNTLIEMVDHLGCNVIVTTGGTGPAIRDVTPEATEAVCERLLPGFGEQMRAVSLQYVPTAILSRQLGGVRAGSLIFNLPGQPKAIRETIDEIWKAVPYCVDLLGGPYIDMNDEVCNAFRPKNARRR
ncbi:MAG: molybdopterin adenylyltransferase [Euryarchaeota archaeon]|jgi:molybdopterin adenylyltransferase|nr:molybdopterin adenylyltransferase [Euryarchaeota archaeon]MBT4982918.1 molybdopterin adenylyltransferase [Euryarchaeota archaeon]MBT5184275.1 molybdopterin adenylyltransferase [Euryarchaeota archaeon]